MYDGLNGWGDVSYPSIRNPHWLSKAELSPSCNERYPRFMRGDELGIYFEMLDLESDDQSGHGSGIMVYNDGKKGYVDPSIRNVIIEGTTGSHKTKAEICWIIYTAMKAGQSVIVTDPKGELCRLFYNSFKEDPRYKTYVLNLRQPDTGNRFNLIEMARRLYAEGKEDAMKTIVDDLVEQIVPNNKVDQYWYWAPKEVLYAFTVYCITHAKEDETVSIKTICDFIAEKTSNRESLHEFRNQLEREGEDYSLISKMDHILDNSDTTGRCVRSEAMAFAGSFTTSSALADMMCDSDMVIDEMAVVPHAIFIVMPDEKDTMNKIAGMIITQIYERMIFLATDRPLPVRINFVIDEAGAIPIPNIDSYVAASRSRNIRFFFAVQSMDQFRTLYPDSYRNIIQNCNDYVFMGSSDYSRLIEISNSTGFTSKGEELITPWQLKNLRRGEEAFFMIDNIPCFIGKILPFYKYDRVKDWKPYEFTYREPIIREETKGKTGDNRAVDDTDKITPDCYAPLFMDSDLYVGPMTTFLDCTRIGTELAVRSRTAIPFDDCMQQSMAIVELMSYFETQLPFSVFFEALRAACRADEITPIVFLRGFRESDASIAVAKEVVKRLSFLFRGEEDD